ncbi:MAG: helix-turn-helix transcriptional regulator [Anaerolineales bacterium]
MLYPSFKASKERDWSQARLAGRLNVSRQTVNAVWTGRYDPRLPLAFKLAALFSCTIEDMFKPDEEEKYI